MSGGNNTNTSRNAEVINDYWQLRERLHTQHSGQKIVCTIGSWDILHEGHVAYLREASEQGDVLVVGVDGDEAYKLYKGQSAYYPEVDRQTIVAALRYVDYVTIVRDVNAMGEWGMGLVREIKPDVFICNDVTYPLKQRKKLEALCPGLVRSLPFHVSPSVAASVKLKRAGRTSLEGAALIATVGSFLASLVVLVLTLAPTLNRVLVARWSNVMKQDMPHLSSVTWAQFVVGLTSSLVAAILAAVVGGRIRRSR